MKIGDSEATLTHARVGDTTVALWRVAELASPAHRQAGRGRLPLLECAAVHFAIFDVETRIDKALVKAVLHRHEEIGDEEAYERTRAQKDFFPLAFHVPVSVVIGEVNDERVLTGVQVLGADGYSEAVVVRGVWDRLVSFLC